MKKIILSFALVFGCLTFANAQQNALGLKFQGADFSVSYQRFLVNTNRLEFNFGVGSIPAFSGSGRHYFTASGLHQWVWNIPDARGFQWYIGAGAGAGFGGTIDFHLNALANVGIEYNFNFPLQLAIDYTAGLGITPEFGSFNVTFNSNSNFWERGFRLAARWRF